MRTNLSGGRVIMKRKFKTQMYYLNCPLSFYMFYNLKISINFQKISDTMLCDEYTYFICFNFSTSKFLCSMCLIEIYLFSIFIRQFLYITILKYLVFSKVAHEILYFVFYFKYHILFYQYTSNNVILYIRLVLTKIQE